MAKLRLLVAVAGVAWALSTIFQALGAPTDPGVRPGASAGGPLPGLASGHLAAFRAGGDDFNAAHSVTGGMPGADAAGLGPTFNLDNCGGCHAAPAVGGTSPANNPQMTVATLHGADNHVPFFITPHGPVREARFIAKPDGTPDGGVHGIFTIAGRSDARGCRLSQPDFDAEATRVNLALRIPTPTFGGGLIENIPDAAILANLDVDRSLKTAFGISGHENRNGNDGTIARFGWKAQNPSLMLFAGEAYNAEMGVTNELFPTERSQKAQCQLNPTPEDHPDFQGGVSGVQHFTDFMRFLAAPVPAHDTPSIARGRVAFKDAGCALCHTPAFMTRDSDIAALSNQPVNLYSDLLVHNMGTGLADHISQGAATGADFRTAPLWGLGQRLFFLHDGRTRDLVKAIQAHRSPGSEANLVVQSFEHLNASLQQDLLNFLRSL